MKRNRKALFVIGLLLGTLLFSQKVHGLEGITEIPQSSVEQKTPTMFEENVEVSETTSPDGTFTIKHYIDHNALFFNNQTTEDFQNKAVWMFKGNDMYEPFAKLGNFDCPKQSSVQIPTPDNFFDGESVKNVGAFSKESNIDGNIFPDFSTMDELWNFNEAPRSTYKSPLGYFEVNHFKNVDQVIFQNPTNTTLENYHVAFVGVHGEWMDEGYISLQPQEKRVIPLHGKKVDGQVIYILDLMKTDGYTAEYWEATKETLFEKGEAENTVGQLPTLTTTDKLIEQGATPTASSSPEHVVDDLGVYFEMRGFTAMTPNETTDLHYHTTTFSDDVKRLHVRLILTDYQKHDYIFKDDLGNLNKLSHLKLSGAFKNATVTDFQVTKPDYTLAPPDENGVVTPPEEVALPDKMDPNASILDFTLSNIDTKEEDGFFTIEGRNNVFGRDYTQQICFKGIQLELATEPNKILDSQETSTPSYTATYKVKNGRLSKTLTASDFTFDGCFKDCVVTSVSQSASNDEFTLKFKKTNTHYIHGEDKLGHICLNSGARNVDMTKDYSFPLSESIQDTYVPALEYDSAAESNVHFKYGSMVVRDSATFIKTLGDTLKEVKALSNFAPFFKSLPIANVLVDVLFTIFGGGQNDAVMQKLQEMDKKLDEIKDSVAQVDSEVVDQSTKQMDIDRLQRLDDDTFDLYHEKSAQMKICNAELALEMMNRNDLSKTDILQATDYMQQLYSTKDNNFDFLTRFQQFARDISGRSDFALLNGKDMLSVSDEYLDIVYDFQGPTYLDVAEQFKSSVTETYCYIYGLVEESVYIDYSLRTAEKENYQSILDELNAMDASKLSTEDKEVQAERKAECRAALNDLKTPLIIDRQLLNLDENGQEKDCQHSESSLDSIVVATEEFQEILDKQEKDLADIREENANNEIYSTRYHTYFAKNLRTESGVNLYIDANGTKGDFPLGINLYMELNNQNIVSGSVFNKVMEDAKKRHFVSVQDYLWFNGFTHDTLPTHYSAFDITEQEGVTPLTGDEEIFTGSTKLEKKEITDDQKQQKYRMQYYLDVNYLTKQSFAEKTVCSEMQNKYYGAGYNRQVGYSVVSYAPDPDKKIDYSRMLVLEYAS